MKPGNPASVHLTTRVALAAALLAGSGGVEVQADEPAAPPPPNVVLILADDLGWADTGAYGNTFIDTPNIDRLAREGVRFTRFYTDPVCSPTRAAIQSGQYSTRLGITDFIMSPQMTGPDAGDYIRGHWRPFEKVDTPLTRRAYPDIPSVADALHGGGYRTGYIGKWHLGFEPGDLPADHGYDVSHVYDGLAGPGGERTMDLMLRDVDEFLENRGSQPFFLFLSPTQPHIPLIPTAARLEKYQKRAAERGQEIPIAQYAAVVEELDDFVGDVSARLERLGLADSTVFIFLSDNGGLENYDLGLGGRVTSNLPLRGEKGTLYEGGIRVPLIVRWPGQVEADTSSDTLTAAYDLLPTLLDISGIAFDAHPDGVSFLPALHGQAMPGERELFFHYPHYHHDRPASTVVTRDWKLIDFLDGGGPELYSLAGDLSESDNVAKARPDKLSALQTDLRQWRQSVGAKLPVENPNYDPARAEEWWNPWTNEQIDREFLRRVFKVEIP